MTPRIHRSIDATCTLDVTSAGAHACATRHGIWFDQTHTVWSKQTRKRAEGACPG